MKANSDNPLNYSIVLPVDIVLHPSWWHNNEGIVFDEDFYFHELKRVETEKKMEQILYNRWGSYGLGKDKDHDFPIIGAVHNAAGFFISEMLGCTIEYLSDNPPLVHCADSESLNLNIEDAFCSKAFKRLEKLLNSLKNRFGYISGDINWSGILNIALDLRGEQIFVDMFDKPKEVKQFFSGIGKVLDRFTSYIESQTKTSSIAVNRLVRHFQKSVFLHSECSNTMISTSDYENYLLDFDIDWSLRKRPFGVHYCGPDLHRYADSFAKITNLDFLDVGWGGDILAIRKKFPDTFLNLRLNPVEIVHQSPEHIETTIIDLVQASDNPYLTGICCINIDNTIKDDQVAAIFKTTSFLREKYLHSISK